MRRVTLAAGLLCALAAQAQPREWRPGLERDGIRVELAAVPGSAVQAVRATMQVPAPAAQVYALLKDPAQRPRWEDNCTQGRAQEVPGEREPLQYFRYHMPWPVSDRDVLERVTPGEDAAAGVFVLHSTATTGLMPAQPGLVRVTVSDAEWTVQAQPGGGTELTLVAHVEPGGPMPAWLINRMLVDSPYQSFVNLRRLLAAGNGKQ
jgi:uncharacterized protein YndB with AHSA1/START domain